MTDHAKPAALDAGEAARRLRQLAEDDLRAMRPDVMLRKDQFVDELDLTKWADAMDAAADAIEAAADAIEAAIARLAAVTKTADYFQEAAEAATRQRDDAREFANMIARMTPNYDLEDNRATLFRLIEKARTLAALSRDSAASGEGWMPIESAPKDGTRIVVFRRGQQYVAEWMSDPWFCWGVNVRTHGRWQPFAEIGSEPEPNDCLELRGPTHWRPLPAPPKEPAP